MREVIKEAGYTNREKFLAEVRRNLTSVSSDLESQILLAFEKVMIHDKQEGFFWPNTKMKKKGGHGKTRKMKMQTTAMTWSHGLDAGHGGDMVTIWLWRQWQTQLFRLPCHFVQHCSASWCVGNSF